MAVSGKSKKELVEENKALRSRVKELERNGTSNRGNSEHELRQHHDHGRLMTVLDSLDALVYVADMETHEILFLNKFGRDIWGDVVGKFCWKTLQTNQTGPCEFCTNAKLIDSSGKPAGIYRWEFQNTVDHQWYDCRDQAVRWTDGRLVRMEIATNITEQKNAQEELKKSKEFLDNIVNALDDSFFVKDQDHHWVMLNDAACELIGRPREELIGKSDYDLFPKEQADIFWEKDNVVIETGRTNVNEEKVTWHGKIRTISTKKSIYTDPVTSEKYITGTTRDITELKQTEETLRTKQKETEALLRATRSIPEKKTFEEAARGIFDAAKALLGADSGYVALLSEDGRQNEVLFLDAGGRQCTVDPNLPMPIRGLRAEAYGKGEVVWDNNFPESKWEEFMPDGHVRLDNVLFAPIIVGGKPVGAIGLANKPGGFVERDAEMAKAFGDIAAVGLRFGRDHEALRESEKKFRSYIENAPDGVLVVDGKGRILETNEAASGITGYSKEELLKMSIPDTLVPESQQAGAEHFGRVVREGYATGELAYLCKDGSQGYWSVDAVKISEDRFLGFIKDITEQKKATEERKATIELLHLINASNDMHEVVGLVMNFLMDWSGCDAFAIRLESSEDFPYFQTNGFSKEFILAESSLCSMNESGELIRDSNGKPYLECMCGNVIRGRFDPSKPFFTEHGSFWTNSTTELLAGTAETDRLARTRNHCNTAGYESVALIPLRAGGETFGLLQFNDKQKGRFTPEKISLMERLADNLAIGLAQMRAEQALKQSEAKYRSLIANIPDIVWTSDKNGNTTFISENVTDIYGYSPEEIYNNADKLWFGRIHPDDIEKVTESFKAIFEKGEPLDLEYRIKRKDGQWIWIRDRSIGAYEKDGVKYADGVFSDITVRKEAEAKIKEQYEFLNLIIESLKHPFYVINPNDYTITIANSAAQSGPISEGQTCYKFTHRQDRPCHGPDHRCPIKEIKKTKQPVIVRHKHYDKDGNLRDMEVHAYPIFDKQGELVQVIEYSIDITERKRVQEALRESLQTSDDIVKAIPSGLFIYQHEEPDKLILINGNPEAERLTGIKISDWKGREFNEIWPAAQESGITEDFLGPMKTGKTFETEDLQYKDKRLEGAFRIRAFRLPADRLAVAFENITEHRKAEEALRQSEQRLKILFEYAPDAICLNDLKGNIVDGNKAAEKIIGYERDELIGKNFLEVGLFSSEQVLRAIAILEKNAMGKPTGPDEFTMNRKDGSSVDVEIRTFPVKIGNQILSLGVASDISARKKAEQKLLEHRAQLKSLASDLSLTEERERHRLATVLHDEIGQSLVFSKLKLDQLRASEPLGELTEALEDVCKHLGKIIHETRTLTFDLSYPILYELGFEVAVKEWLTHEVGEKHGITTQFEDDGRPKPLEDDIRVLLFRNIRELLINIVKHANAQNVKISLRRISQQIYVSVEDDGVGFNPAEVAPNAGFGIFSIRERLEQLTGHLEIESEPGQGSKITMTAPLECDKQSRDNKLKSR
ncbi:MAG: PAS domain S-box protein [Planctomycetota bacterium]